jgi:membrane protease YdiL (CAAX protease family)
LSTLPELPPLQADLPRPHPAWSLGDVVRITLLAIFAIFLSSTIAVALASNLPAFEGTPPSEIASDARVLVPAQSLAYLFILGIMYLTVTARARDDFWHALRWRWPAPDRALTCLVAGVALSVGVQLASQVLPIPSDLPIERLFRDPFAALLLALFGTLVAPLMEELFFRGLLYPVLEKRLGMVLAVAVTASFFAVIHSAQLGAAWAPLLLLFTVGLIITLVRAFTGSVAAGFLVHVAYNGLIFVLMYFATGGFRNLERLSGS